MAAQAQSIASTVSENVFERLREDLKSTLFPPSDRLKVEEMRDKYDVSTGRFAKPCFAWWDSAWSPKSDKKVSGQRPFPATTLRISLPIESFSNHAHLNYPSATATTSGRATSSPRFIC